MNTKRQKMYGNLLKIKQLTETRVLLLREELCKIDGHGEPCSPYKRWGVWITEIKNNTLDTEGVQVWRSTNKKKALKYFESFE